MYLQAIVVADLLANLLVAGGGAHFSVSRTRDGTRFPSKPRRRRYLIDQSTGPSGDRNNDPDQRSPLTLLRCPHRRQPNRDPTEISLLGHVYVHLLRNERLCDQNVRNARVAYPSSFFRTLRKSTSRGL